MIREISGGIHILSAETGSTGTMTEITQEPGSLLSISGAPDPVNQLPEHVHKFVTFTDLPPTYTGPTEFTPSGSEQVALTAGLMVEQDIIINPIPSNYGLVTWNGSVLTVS
jgi:hypothetical protein